MSLWECHPCNTGLSPRVRGNPLRPSPVHPHGRSIPACAGEPCLREAERMGSLGVYPRVCGGTSTTVVSSQSINGLSPRVRGNRGRLIEGRAVVGSIPACAGEPPFVPPLSPRLRVYPRVCGGTIALHRETIGMSGLSPRVRGNRGVLEHVTASDGSIPARAGEPLIQMERQLCDTVYPRACGGTRRMPIDPRIPTGLSPRVRGNPRGSDSP